MLVNGLIEEREIALHDETSDDRCRHYLADQFWRDRYGMIADPFGHRWSIASRLEDLSPRDLHERAETWASDRKERA
jgi:hypothetical protein